MKWKGKLKLLRKKMGTNSDILFVRNREPIRTFRNQSRFSDYNHRLNTDIT
jgi:hypothetical protein